MNDLLKKDAKFSKGLKKNPEALALLDVHAVEPIPANSPILPLPNARLSPHLASRTASAMERMSAMRPRGLFRSSLVSSYVGQVGRHKPQCMHCCTTE